MSISHINRDANEGVVDEWIVNFAGEKGGNAQVTNISSFFSMVLKSCLQGHKCMVKDKKDG